MGTSIKLGFPYFDAMLIYQLSQKLKLLGNGEFNHFNQNSIKVYILLMVFLGLRYGIHEGSIDHIACAQCRYINYLFQMLNLVILDSNVAIGFFQLQFCVGIAPT